jgi:nitroreductase
VTSRKQIRSKLGAWKREQLARTSGSLRRVVGPRTYFYVSGSFNNEQKAVTAGMKAHYNGERDHNHRMFLRRSVHRLEKGLSASPMRSTFAADYIQRTVRTYEEMRTSSVDSIDTGELQWAEDVLGEYFKATADSTEPRIVAARQRWEHPPAATVPLVPFPHQQLQQAADSFAGLSRLACHRRSVRLFDDVPVDRSTVERAVEIGLQAPSACNRQSLRLVLVDDPDLRKKVAAVPMGTAGFASQIPLIAVLVGQLRGYEHERDRHAIFVDGGLFSMGFALALEGLGLNSCCINWPDLDQKEQAMRQLITMDPDERVIMLIAIGHGTQGQLVPRSHKRDVKAVAQWV